MADESEVCIANRRLPVSRLEPGEMGVLLARAGAGKTACLTHFAIGYLLDKNPVLHVCVDVVPEKVKLWYQKLLKDIFSNQAERKISEVEHAIEPMRFILSFLNQTFSPEKLESSIDNLKQQARFVPELIILDGLDFGHARALFEKISDLARRNSASVWVSARSHRHRPDVNERGIPYPIDAMDDLFSSVLMLEQINDRVCLKALKEKGSYNPAGPQFTLDPDTFLPQ